jgi:hypothetical protein
MGNVCHCSSSFWKVVFSENTKKKKACRKKQRGLQKESFLERRKKKGTHKNKVKCTKVSLLKTKLGDLIYVYKNTNNMC